MESTTGPALPPTYKQLLEEMGKQIGQRKTALMKRVLLITWPFLLLIVAGYVSSNFFNLKDLPKSAAIPVFLGFGIYVFLALIYSIIVRFIFSIEKRIWVDSYFDQKNLSLQESWRIAKKLFWPAFTMRFKLWARYIGAPLIIVVIIALFYLNILVVNRGFSDAFLTNSLVGYVVVFLLFAIYTYYIRLKLRYTWFIFLDKFGSEYSLSALVEEMNKLNAISKTETFKKSLVANIGTDSLNSVAKMAVRTISFGISQFGGVGQMVGSAFRVYGEEMGKQATELGNISAQYILYRFARKEAYGTEQEVNENIYKIN